VPGGPGCKEPWFCCNGLCAESGFARETKPLGGRSPKGLGHESMPAGLAGEGAGGALGGVGRLSGLGACGNGCD
jgi:hypothetical protein